MDYKQAVFAATMFTAAYTHSMTKVSVQLFVRRFGPDPSSDGDFHAILGTNRCLMKVLQLTDKVSEKGRQLISGPYILKLFRFSTNSKCPHIIQVLFFHAPFRPQSVQ